MRRAIPVLSLLLLGACGESGPPTPGVPTTFETVCGKANEDKRVSLEGYLDFPPQFSVSKGAETTVMLRMRPAPDSGGAVVGASVRLGNGANHVEMPPKSYTSAHLKVHTADGATVGHRDKIKVSGTMYYPSAVAKVDFKCGLTNTLVESAGK